jgi:hypothetical protein
LRIFISDMIKKSFLYFCLALGCVLQSVSAQDSGARDTTLKEYSSLLKALEAKIFKATTDEEKEESNRAFLNLFRAALLKDREASYPFDSVKFVSRIAPEDKSLRIFTWSIPKVDGSGYTFYGFIQLVDNTRFLWIKRRRALRLVELKDRTSEIADPENTAKLTPDKWYGAYYYSVLVNSYRGKKYYTLLGWKGRNMRSTRKVIDNFTLTGDKIVFGAPIFRNEKLVKNRMVFEFNARSSMLLRYERNVLVQDLVKPVKKKKNKKHRPRITKENLIVFDHLSPGKPVLEGQYEHYGPDLSFDALKFNKGKWQYFPAIDIRNEDKKVNDEKNRVVKSRKPKEGEDEFYRKYK